MRRACGGLQFFCQSAAAQRPMSGRREVKEKHHAHAQHEYRIDRVVFLGTASATPVPGKRNMSSLCVAGNNGSVIMVDCGEGTQHQLKVSTALKASKVDMILITHLHGDHCFGLFGLIYSLADARGAAHAEERPACDGAPAGHPLILVGPVGLRAMVEQVLAASGGWGDAFHIRFIEISQGKHDARETVDLTDAILLQGAWGEGADDGESGAGEDGIEHYILHRVVPPSQEPQPSSAAHRRAAFAECRASAAELFGQVRVRAVPLIHRLPSWGYVVQEPTRPGKLDLQQARALGVPNGPLLGQLKAGRAVEFTRGGDVVAVRPEECVGAPVPGRKVCVLQDSCDSQYALDACRGADLFVHECTFEKAMEADALRKGHSTTHMAAAWANACGAKTLVLTHFSARYTESSARIAEARREHPMDPLDISPTDPTETVLGPEAREVFTGGDVVVAHDFMVLDGNAPTGGFQVKKQLAARRNPWLR